jgi:FkbM family methyltransferase
MWIGSLPQWLLVPVSLLICGLPTRCLSETTGTADGKSCQRGDRACEQNLGDAQASLLQLKLVIKAEDEARPLDSSKDAQQMLLGKCLEEGLERPIEYISTALTEADHTLIGPTAQKQFAFSDGPWPGMYNPSIVQLPASQTGPSAKFAMTVRRDLHQCQGHVKENSSMSRAIPESHHDTVAQIFLLDANYCVSASSPLTITGPVKRVAQDIRLSVYDDKLYASYVMWQFDPTRMDGKGLWLAPIKLNYAPLTSHIDSSRAVRLGGHEEKNYGLFQYQSKMMALTWIDWTNRPSPIRGASDIRPTAEKKGKWHNSANFLQLQDGSGDLLGMMHVHTDQASDNGGFEYGSFYRQRFFKMSGSPPFVMKSVGEEFCMKAVDESCETVQMVMSMMQTSNDSVLVSYGVNDCESKMASFALSSILQQLVPPPLGKENVEVMQVPEVQLSLMDLAETVSSAPLWRFGHDDEDMAPSYEAGLNLPRSLHDIERYESCNVVAGTYGDWPVCNDWLPTACIAYDFGIANQWEFSDSMAKNHGCEVHSFDPSDGHLEQHYAHHQPNVSFHFLGLDGGDAKPPAAAWTDTSDRGYGAVIAPLQRLDRIMATLGHSAVDVLKIDCEGCEWESLAGVVRAAPEALSCVRVLLIELHFAKRFAASNSSLANAAETSQHLRSNGWKAFFAVQRGWGPDQKEQELSGWKEVGGDSCCYNVGFVNPHFDATKCALPKGTVSATPDARSSLQFSPLDAQ